MKPATILSQSEGRRLHRLATNMVDLTALLLAGKPKRRRRRKAKATATATAKPSAKPTPKAKKSAKSYPVETTN